MAAETVAIHPHVLHARNNQCVCARHTRPQPPIEALEDLYSERYGRLIPCCRVPGRTVSFRPRIVFHETPIARIYSSVAVMRCPSLRRAASSAAAMLVLTACGGDSGTGPGGGLTVATITIDTVSFATERGTHLTLTATARDDQGKPVTVPFTWQSDNEAVVSFGPDGRFAALDTGVAIITASSLGVTSSPIGIQVIWVGAADIAASQWTPPVAATPGAVVTDSVRVLVTNRIGGPARGSHVVFSVAGGGVLSAMSATTDSLGRVAAGWTLGPSQAVNTVTATVVDDQGTRESWVTGNPVTFTIRAFDALTATHGDAQTGQILSALAVAPSVLLVDSTGAPRPGVVVSFVASNGGRVPTPTIATGADGVASPGPWTLGDAPGDQTLVATVGIATLTIHAMATGTPIHYVPSAIASAGFSTCAINTDGTANCWGAQPNVGNGASLNASAPTAVAGAIKFTAIKGSQTHFCGLAADASIHCWGVNSLTDTSGATTSSGTPARLPSSQSWMQVAPGYAFNCALDSSGAAYCWGDNATGELGDGTSTNRFTPAPVLGGFIFSSVVSGAGHACGLTAGGTAFCWGLNANGQLGDGSTVSRTSPTVVRGGLTFQSLGAGASWTCGLSTAGQVYCWGNISATDQQQTTPSAYSSTPIFTTLTVGGAHACGLTGDGSAYCWGNNNWGQIGDSTTTVRDVPTPVAGGLTFSAISAGYAHTCALAKPEGAVTCWGLNSAGEIGNSLVAFQLAPRFIVLGVTP